MFEEYTLKLDDTGKTLEVNGENPNDQTEVVIPENSNTPFPIGTQIKIYRGNEKKVVLRGQTPVVELKSTSRGIKDNFVFFIPRYSEAQIRKNALNEWSVSAKGIPLVFAEGGDEVFDFEQNGVIYRVHAFTTVGENRLEVLGGSGGVEVLIVAGGGSGGLTYGGGGGGGGFISASVEIPNSGIYSVVVGEGGGPATENPPLDGSTVLYLPGNNGGNSSFMGFVAVGGGAGGTGQASAVGGTDGGSGGGASSSGVFGSGLIGQGNSGGGYSTSGWSSSPAPGGGGGGAGQSGFSSRFNIGNGLVSKGGDGLSSDIISVDLAQSLSIGEVSGGKVWFAGGGGGSQALIGHESSFASIDAGLAGLGGGGRGQNRSLISTRPGEDGKPNTGGGSGGTDVRYQPASVGGSGIVIVRYPIRRAED